MIRNRLTALIVDDQRDARSLLKHMLQSHLEVDIIDEANSAESALFKFMNTKPDIVFLDLVMPGKNGMEFIELIKNQKIETNIVITSAYPDLAIDAIKNEVYDFLLKPIGPRKLKSVLTKIQQKKITSRKDGFDKILKQIKHDSKLKLTTINSHILIDPEHILYCEAEGSYTHFYLSNGNTELANTYLGKVEDVLSEYNFYRISRSILINLDKLWRVNKNEPSCVLLDNNKEVKIIGSKKPIRDLCKSNAKPEK